jgi:hypothetical protein
MGAPNSDLSSAWRKIERSSTDDKCKRDVELLYEHLESINQGSGDAGSLPEDLVHCLVKLMGNKHKIEPPKPALESVRNVPLRPNVQPNRNPVSDPAQERGSDSDAVTERDRERASGCHWASRWKISPMPSTNKNLLLRCMQ